MAANLDHYVARICWNSNHWVRPSGEAANVESNTYATKMGFGHEEWLFNFEWVLDGWKYGFLQPVGKSRAKIEGQSIDVRLYSIGPDADWFYVGHIKLCEVLGETTARVARREFKKRGWYGDMLAQLEQVKGDVDGLKYEEAVTLFNIRYKPTDAVLYDPMVPVGRDDMIRRLRRYTLVPLTGELETLEKQWATRVGTTELRRTGKQIREAIPTREVDLVHNQLQNELFEHLVKKFGAEAVVLERGFADIALRHDGKTTLIEIKADSRPRFAIRQALGQLLEYGYVAQQNGERIGDLVVAGPGELQTLDRYYLRHLREERGLPVQYLCVRRGFTDLDV